MRLFKKSDSDKYDFILGRDFQQDIGLDILNSKRKLAWDDIEIEMISKREVDRMSVAKLEELCKIERKTGIFCLGYQL